LCATALMHFVDLTVCVAIQQYISRHDVKSPTPENNEKSSRRMLRKKRKLMQADDLDVDDVKQRRTSSEIESEKKDIGSAEEEVSFPDVAADSVISAMLSMLRDEEKQTNNVDLTSEEMTCVEDVAEITDVENVATYQKEDTDDVICVSDGSSFVEISDENGHYEISPLEKAIAEETCEFEVISDTDLETVNPASQGDTLYGDMTERVYEEAVESVSLFESSTAAEQGMQTEGCSLSIEAEVESAGQHTGCSPGDQLDVCEQLSASVSEEHCHDAGDDLLPTSTEVTCASVADPGLFAGEAAGEAVACQSLMPMTEDLQLSSQSTAIGYTESSTAAGHDMQTEDCSLSAEAEVESAGLHTGCSRGDQLDACEQMSATVSEEHYHDAGDDLLTTSTEVTCASVADRGSSAGEAAGETVACQSLLPLTEDLQLSSQSTAVSYTESSAVAEQDMQTEGCSLSTEAGVESAGQHAGCSTGDQLDVCEQMSANVSEEHYDAGDDLLPTSTEVTCASVADRADEHILPTSTDVTCASDAQRGSSTGEAAEKGVASQILMPQLSEDLQLSSQSTAVSYIESSAADMQMEGCSLSTEAEVESAEPHTGCSLGDQRDVTVCIQPLESVTEALGDGAEENSVLTSTDVAHVSADGDDSVDDGRDSLTGGAAEKADACQSLIPPTDESSSQSTIVDDTESWAAAEHDMQMEDGALSIEPEAETVEVYTGCSPGDQLDITVREQVFESVVKERVDDAEEHILPTSTDVPCASDAQRGWSTVEAAEKAVATQILMPQLSEDLQLSSQSAAISYRDGSTAAEHDVAQMESGTLSAETEVESAELCTGLSSGDLCDVAVCEQVSESVMKEHDDTDEHPLPTSIDVAPITPAAAAAAAADTAAVAEEDDNNEVEIL